MKSELRLTKLEKHYRTRIDVCHACGKTTEDWSYTVILHSEHDYSTSSFGCDVCRYYHKLLVFPEDMYQEELHKPRSSSCKVMVL